MDFWNFVTLREACKRSGIPDDPESFYRMVFADAVKMGSGQFLGQITNERDLESTFTVSRSPASSSGRYDEAIQRRYR